VVTDAERSISALLGASPGASVSVHVMLEVIRKCFSRLLESESGRGRMKEMIPSFDEDLKLAQSADRFAQLDERAEKDLFG
jgi:malate dehydrogenase (quinone)